MAILWSTLVLCNEWSMENRFMGFRFELFGNVINVGLRNQAQQVAHELGCFGWIQNTEKVSVVNHPKLELLIKDIENRRRGSSMS